MTRPASEATLAAGALVGHYKISRLIGRGGTGEVYLARDTHLGRRVALKLVHLPREGEATDRQQALDDFLSEARITARFNHPHIVTVYGVGRHSDRPYVAFEYLEGQSLRPRLREERPGLKEATRIGLAITEALAEAHRNQVLHRDLKPENVMLPTDGRLRVVDFGLATAPASRGSSAPPVPAFADDAIDSTRDGSPESSRTTQVVGTPRYIAPEVWKQQSATTASDVWALGMILCELFCGRHPYASLTRIQLYQQVCSDESVPPMPSAEELPAELVELVARCVDKDPRRRPSAREVADGLRRFLALSRHPLPEEVSPFRGLLPFTERDADMFFGRDDEIGAFLERLRVTPVLPVVGPSGAGKSSFVQAGVVPRLRDRGHWITLLLRPGKDPFRALAGALHEAGGYLEETTVPGNPLEFESEFEAMEALASGSPDSSASDVLANQLHHSPGRLSLSLQQIAETQRGRVLLIVDQLEELYTLVEDDEIRQRFMQAICTAADDEQAPVRVIFTLRDDFIGRLAATAEARETLSHVTVLGSPGPEALRQILTKPLERVGYRYDAVELVERMIRAIQGEMAGLPVLQFALRQLWDRRDRDHQLLTTEAYDEMDGVEGALAGHADGILNRLTPAQVRLAREIFLRLVTAQGTRRIASRQALLEGLGPDAAEVLDILTHDRVVLARRAHGDRDAEAELELVHESLISNWRRLARWLEESREGIAFLTEIGQAAELWEKRGRSNHEVWRDATLQEAEIKITRCQVVPPLVQAFMAASRRLSRRRARRRRIAIAVVMIALAVVGIVFAVKEREVRHQREVAETQWERAEIREAEAQREGALSALVRGDPLEARAKLRRSLETRDSTLARILWWRLSANPLHWRHRFGAMVFQTVFSPDGKTVAAGCMDNSIYLFDVETKEVEVLRGHGDQVFSVRFSPDGKRLVAGTWSGPVWLWDLERRVPTKLEGHTAGVWALAFGPDGELIASGGFDKQVRLWDGKTGQDRGILFTADQRVMAVDFSPDGSQLLVAGCDEKVRLFDVASRREIRTLSHGGSCVLDANFGPRGQIVVSSARDGTVRTWDAASGKQLRVLHGNKAKVVCVAVDPHGELLATGGEDKTIRIWRMTTGQLVQELHGHETLVAGLDFSPDGTRLVSGSHDTTLRVWDLSSLATRDSRSEEATAFYGVSFSPDGKLVAASNQKGRVRILSVETGAEQTVLRAHDDPVYVMAFSTDGSILATAGEGRKIFLWDTQSWIKFGEIAGHTSAIRRVLFTRSGDQLISSGADGTIRIWDTKTWEPILIIREQTGTIHDVALSPDEQTMVSVGGDRTLRLWDRESGAQLRLFEGHEEEIWGGEFTPDGQWIASGSSDRTVRLWNVETGASRELGRHDSRIYRVAMHPDGKRVVTCSADKTIRAWNIETGDSTLLRGHRGEINEVKISGDGELAVSASDDGTVRLWDLDTSRGVWRAPLMIADPPQLFTHLGWIDLDSSSAARVDDTAWRRVIAERADHAAVASDRGPLCVATHDEELQIWDREADATTFTNKLPGLHHVLARPEHCLALVGDRAHLFRPDGSSRELASKVSAAAADPNGILLAAEDRVLVYDAKGERLGDHATSPGATALVRVGEWLALGYQDGTIELYPTLPDAPRPRFAFERVPASPVVQLADGPIGTLVAGFANGLWGIWDLRNGTALYQAQLHGPVVHLLLQGGKLYAASELGQYSVLDVSMFDRDYCDLMRELWGEVPVSWENGLPVLSAPPDGHPCRSSTEGVE